jgi:hypothetical protein
MGPKSSAQTSPAQRVSQSNLHQGPLPSMWASVEVTRADAVLIDVELAAAQAGEDAGAVFTVRHNAEDTTQKCVTNDTTQKCVTNDTTQKCVSKWGSLRVCLAPLPPSS